MHTSLGLIIHGKPAFVFMALPLSSTVNILGLQVRRLNGGLEVSAL